MTFVEDPANSLDCDRIAGANLCLQQHRATRLRFDLRLELNGTLKSWAVPKGLALDPAEKAFRAFAGYVTSLSLSLRHAAFPAGKQRRADGEGECTSNGQRKSDGTTLDLSITIGWWSLCPWAEYSRMSTATTRVDSEMTILRRIVESEAPGLSVEAAHAILRLDFTPRDRTRMNRLAARNRAGELRGSEEELLENYIRVGQILGIFKSKARRSLKLNGKQPR